MSAIIKARNEEISKITDKYYTSKGYIQTDGIWKNPKTGFKAKSVMSKNQYSKVFEKFWDKEFIAGNTTIYYNPDKVYNPETKKFVNKKNRKVKKKEIYQNQVINPQNYIENEIIPQLQNAIESGNKTTIKIEAGRFGSIKNLLDILPFGDKKMYFVNKDGSYYFLNSENIKRIAEVETQFSAGVKMDEASYTSSDGNFIIDTIYQNNSYDLVIENFNNPILDGGFFPFTHNLELLDLERYHIYHKLDTESANKLHDKNCLLHAIEMAGYDISQLKVFVKNQNVPIRSLHEIANILNVLIRVRNIKDKSNIRPFGNKTTPNIIELGLIDNHYFLIEDTKYTSYSVKNYFEIKNKGPEEKNHDWNRVYKIKGKKDSSNTYLEKSDKRFISSYAIIKTLKECEATHLKPLKITNPIFHTNYYDKINIYDKLDYNKSCYSTMKGLTAEPQYLEGNPIGFSTEGNLLENKLRVLNSQKKTEGEHGYLCKKQIFFDFECSTRNDKGTETNHKAYLINTDEIKGLWNGGDCGKQFLDYIVDKYGEDATDKEMVKKVQKKEIVVRIIAHNSGYDFRFIQEYLYSLETLEKGNGLFTATGTYYSKHNGEYKTIQNEGTFKTTWVPAPQKKIVRVEIVDSLKMINMGLGKFNGVFELGETKKEIMPYDLYTEENVEKRYLDIPYVEKFLEKLKGFSKSDIKQFWDNCDKWDCMEFSEFDEDGDPSVFKVDIIKYSSEYCSMDCKTLKAGYMKFRKLTLEACDLDITDFVSLASLADYYLKREGCYDFVYQFSGIVRAFIQECVVGGRTMVRRNQKFLSVGTKQKVDTDYDKIDKSQLSLQELEEFKNALDTTNMTTKQRNAIVRKKLADFDGVSLYPSAMNRMLGFLQGTPNVIREWNDTGIREDFEGNKVDSKIDKSYDGYFIKIKITKIGKFYQFPLISFKDENGIRQFTNDCVGREIFVDKTYLEDLINFQKIEYEFIQGYYFDEGRNKTINKVIQHLFNTRLKFKSVVYVYEDTDTDKNNKIAEYVNKKEFQNSIHKDYKNYVVGNAIQMVFKELMNSSYGKSYLKPIDTDTQYISENNKDKFVDRNFNYIKEFTQLANGNFKVKTIKTINNHFNNVHIGVEILSMSKRIMNEVMTLAEDLGIDMYITDTDSIHMDLSKVELMETEFDKKYPNHIGLIGKQMGQFHVDFDVKGADTDNIWAENSIFLGKKSYYDLLETINTDGTKLSDEHIRLKGIPNDSIFHRAEEGIWTYDFTGRTEDGTDFKYTSVEEFKKSIHKNETNYKKTKNTLIKDFGGSVFELYKYLYEGNEVSFNLVANRPKFQFNKNMTIQSKSVFDRKLKFPDKPCKGFGDFDDN